MYRALSVEQSAELETAAVEAGVSLYELMLQAGAALADEVALRVPEGAVVVIAGPGNNGGDGWVAARMLHAAGRSVWLYSTVEPDVLRGEAALAARDAIAAGLEFSAEIEPDPTTLAGAVVVIDALLGTGARLPLRGVVRDWCATIRGCDAYVISADLPSGVDADSGAVDPAAVAADCTVTFSQPKIGLVTYPAASHAGELVVADIGVPDSVPLAPDAPVLLTTKEYAELVPLPDALAHKNSRGRLLVIAGSVRFPGAAVLCARGAMRMGAGYVTLAVPADAVPIAQAHLLAVPVVGLPTDGDGSLGSDALGAIRELAASHDAVVLGPGLTTHAQTVALVHDIIRETEVPLLIDADGLNALAADDGIEQLASRPWPTVLTPHVGELSRLLGIGAVEVESDRVRSSRELVTGSTVILLKGPGTVVSGHDESTIVTSGTPALATAGSGDVLSGMIGALLAQRMEAYDAARLGAYVHGLTGEVAAADLTPVAVNAEDLPDRIPAALGMLLQVR